MSSTRQQPEVNLRRICGTILLVYIIAAAAFYFLAGDQLFSRDSKNNITGSVGNLATGELYTDDSVTQLFRADMDTIHTVSVRLATFARQNTGVVNVDLYDAASNTIKAHWSLDMAGLVDSAYTSLALPEPLHGCRGQYFLLGITVPGGAPGNTVASWYDAANPDTSWQLYFNGEPFPGVLSFQVFGTDNIWTGPHYWQLVLCGGAVLALYCAVTLYRQKRGKSSLIVNAITALSKYRFLIEQLVARDFKSKYKRSVLGVLWSFLNPLLTMTVQYIIFSTIFKADVKNYPVYLLTGVVLFSFFSEATNMSLMSIVGNASLITKVYVPKYIYPVTRVLSSSVNLLISLIPLFIMVLFTRTRITISYLLLIFPVACLIVFCIGMAFLMSSAMVFFRDTQFLWSVFSMLWMYATPIFYPENILPEGIDVVLKINPMYHFIKFSRIVIINGISPEPRLYLACALVALAFLAVGAFVFRKTQDKFVFYI